MEVGSVEVKIYVSILDDMGIADKLMLNRDKDREDIEKMPLNYQTELTSDGAGISGGQRQRIALARALLTDAPIMILDEATSSLDILTEKRIVDNLLSLDKTLIFIAHRLTIAERTEHIVVLDKGRIVEQGSHKELLDKQGFYEYLVNS
jgi:competence factor transporting protein